MQNGFVREVRHAVRGLLSARGFTAVAVLSLGIGIGLNTAMFSLVNAVLLRPLPVARPGELVRVYTSAEVPEATFSYLDYRDLQRDSRSFSGLAGHSLMFANLDWNGSSRLVLGEVVTANYFDVLGVSPRLGRAFAAEDDATEGGNRVALISERLWHQQYGGDGAVIGHTLRLRGTDYTILGVVPARFTGMTPGLAADVWVPVSMVEDVEPVGYNDVVASPTGTTRLTRRGSRWMFVTGRLAPGVTIAQARTDTAALMERLAQGYPETNRDRRATIRPLSDVRIHPMIDGALAPAAAGLMVGVGLVLLIACANIANMLLARGAARGREVAIRLALGASRRRIVRELLIESLVLAVAGAVTGTLLAAWSLRLLTRFQPPLPVPISLDLGMDARVLLFTAAASIATGLLFGLVPALRTTKPNLVPALKDDALSGASSRRGGLRGALVVAQVALSIVLLVTAALLTRSALSAAGSDVGFNSNGLALATVDVQMLRYTSDRGRSFYDAALARVRALPGVSSAALVERLPFSPNVHTNTIVIDGRDYPPGASGDVIDVTRVSSGYFATLGVPILEGRDFDSRDTPQSTPVAVINQAMARKYWPGADPIGRQIRVGNRTTVPIQIVGVIPDHTVRTIGESPRPFIHFARTQAYAPSATILARTAGDANMLAGEIRGALLGIEPRLVFVENGTMRQEIDVTLFPARAAAVLAAGFGTLALALAAVGLYGVMAFWVGRRTREIGVRVALGADPAGVVRMVMREGLMLVLIGCLPGALAAFAIGRALAASLYHVGALDPAAYSIAFLLLTLVSAVATLVPARRAARVDPMVALRTS